MAGRRYRLWSYVVSHFEKFLKELELSPTERQDAEAKALRISKSLFAAYYPDQSFNYDCYGIVGSYGKGTAGRPRTDVDMIFVFPVSEFDRFNGIVGNKQSYLLQDVKSVLLDTFPNTDIKGDGPVVKVPFSTYDFEVVPVFRYEGNLFITPHTKNGGSWGYSNPAAEIQCLRNTDGSSLNKGTHLVKMLKAWKRECNVEMRSVCLEVAATCFIDQWVHKGQGLFYYDWMVRDFFEYLLRFRIDGWAKPAGIDEKILLGDLWQSKCQTAYDRAAKASDYEHKDQEYLAAIEWQKIFGSQFKAEFNLQALLAGFPVNR